MSEQDWKCEDKFIDAPFCKGDSIIECWDNSQVPQGELCPPNPCEEDGTCDDHAPPPHSDCDFSQRSARGYCDDPEGHAEEREQLMEDNEYEDDHPSEDLIAASDEEPTEVVGEVQEAPEPELAVTGGEIFDPLLGLSLVLIATGAAIVRKVKA